MEHDRPPVRNTGASSDELIGTILLTWPLPGIEICGIARVPQLLFLILSHKNSRYLTQFTTLLPGLARAVVP